MAYQPGAQQRLTKSVGLPASPAPSTRHMQHVGWPACRALQPARTAWASRLGCLSARRCEEDVLLISVRWPGETSFPTPATDLRGSALQPGVIHSRRGPRAPQTHLPAFQPQTAARRDVTRGSVTPGSRVPGYLGTGAALPFCSRNTEGSRDRSADWPRWL